MTLKFEPVPDASLVAPKADEHDWPFTTFRWADDDATSAGDLAAAGESSRDGRAPRRPELSQQD